MSAASEGTESQTLKQLKTNLKNALKKSGVLDTVKAQIRKEFIAGLTDKVPAAASYALAALPKSGAGTGASVVDLRERLTLSLVYHFLKQRRFHHALSVYAAECGLDSKAAWLSEMDIVKSMQYGTQSDVYRAVVDKENAAESAAESAAVSVFSPNKLRNSLFDILLAQLHVEPGKGSLEMSVQTDSAAGSLRGPRESLDYQMQHLRSSFLSQRDAERANPARSIEERMIAFQKECEERYRREADSYVAYARETEVAKVRLDEAQKARTEVEALRKQLEADYQRRLHEHGEREDAALRAMTERERQLQQLQYDTRQQMQREIDDLRSREAAGQRKLELETQGLQALELRLKEVKAVLESREREAARREQLADEKYNECMERAKSDARGSLRAELDAVQRERGDLKLDRQRVDDEMASQAALLDSAKTTRRMLKEAQADLLVRDDDIEALRRKLDAANEKLSHFPDDWEDELQEDGTARPRSLVSVLKHRIVALEAGLTAQASATKEAEIEKRIALVSEAFNARADQLKEQLAKQDAELGAAHREKEMMRRAAQSERAAAESARAKNEELVRIIREQKATIDRLIKQQEGVARNQQSNKAIEDIAQMLASRRRRDPAAAEPLAAAAPPPPPPPQYYPAPYGYGAYPPPGASWGAYPPPAPAPAPYTSQSFETSLPTYQPVTSLSAPPATTPAVAAAPAVAAPRPSPSVPSDVHADARRASVSFAQPAEAAPGPAAGGPGGAHVCSRDGEWSETFSPRHTRAAPVETSADADVAAVRDAVATQAAKAQAEAEVQATKHAHEVERMKVEVERMRLEMERKDLAAREAEAARTAQAARDRDAAVSAAAAAAAAVEAAAAAAEAQRRADEERRRAAEQADAAAAAERQERERADQERLRRDAQEDKRRAEEAAEEAAAEARRAAALEEAAKIEEEKRSAQQFIEVLQRRTSQSPEARGTAAGGGAGGGGFPTSGRSPYVSSGSAAAMEMSAVEKVNDSVSAHHHTVDEDMLSPSPNSPRSPSFQAGTASAQRGSAVMAKSTFDKILEESMGMTDESEEEDGSGGHAVPSRAEPSAAAGAAAAKADEEEDVPEDLDDGPSADAETEAEREAREAAERKRLDDEEMEERRRKVAERRRQKQENEERDAEIARRSQEELAKVLKSPSAASDGSGGGGGGAGDSEDGDADSPVARGPKLFADNTEIEIESQIEEEYEDEEDESSGW